MSSGRNQVSALHRVIVGVCSALILVLAVGSLFEKGGLTEDPETHVPLDPRGALIGIPIGVGGLIFSLAGIGFRRRRHLQNYRTYQANQASMPRVDRIDTFAQQISQNTQGRAPMQERKVFWTTPAPDPSSRKRPRSE